MATPAPYAGTQDALGYLLNAKKTVVLERPGNGYVTLPDATLISKHNPSGVGALDVGLGWVKAVESLLLGLVKEIRFDIGAGGTAFIGEARITSSTKNSYDYKSQWFDRGDESGLLLGSQAYGATYQAGQLAFAYLYASGARELTERWFTLVQNGIGPGRSEPLSEVELQNNYPHLRTAILYVAESLRRSYHREFMPTNRVRSTLGCQYAPLDLKGQPLIHHIEAADLLDLNVLGSRVNALKNMTVPVAVPTPTAAQAAAHVTPVYVQVVPSGGSILGIDGDLDQDDDGAQADPTLTQAAAIAAMAPDPVAPVYTLPSRAIVLHLDTLGYRMVKETMSVPGSSFFPGPPGGGKSAYIEQCALEWLDAHPRGPGRLEVIRFEPGLRSDLVLGSNVPRKDGDGFLWVDGPAARVFRYVATEHRPAVLFGDELPRAHSSVGPLFMSWAEPTSRRTVEAQGLVIDYDDPEDLYHVIRIAENQDAFVLPSFLFKIVAAGNIGDKDRQTLSTEEEAFRSRWMGGWTFIDEPTRSEMAEILSLRLGLPTGHDLIAAMLNVHQAIAEYDGKEGDLVMTTNLRILLAWGRQILVKCLAHHAANTPSAPTAALTRGQVQAQKTALDPTAHARLFFVPTAELMWLNMLVKMPSGRPNRDMEKIVHDIVERCAPKQRT